VSVAYDVVARIDQPAFAAGAGALGVVGAGALYQALAGLGGWGEHEDEGDEEVDELHGGRWFGIGIGSLVLICGGVVGMEVRLLLLYASRNLLTEASRCRE
jgi:hypothetical protein